MIYLTGASGLVGRRFRKFCDRNITTISYREEVYDPDTDKKGVALINVAKQRNGSIGQFNLTFLGRYTKFENWVPEYEQI